MKRTTSRKAKNAENLIRFAISKGAALYANISGGKDGQAMTSYLHRTEFPMSGAVHADLGRIEWAESIIQCRKTAYIAGIKLHIVRRADGLDMIQYWARRMRMMKDSGPPLKLATVPVI